MLKQFGYPEHGKYLILHADDWGLNRATNEAISLLFQKQAITSASILTAAPEAQEACRFAAVHQVCAGVHLALSGPLAPPAGTWDSSDLPGKETADLKKPEAGGDVAAPFFSLLSQVKHAYSQGVRVTHLDCHQGSVLGIDNDDDRLLEFVWALCREYGVPFKLPRQIVNVPDFSPSFRERMSRHLDWAEAKGIPLIDDLIVPEYQLLPDEDYSSYKAGVLQALKSLRPGFVTELTLHPAAPDAQLESQDRNWTKRVWEFQICLDEDFRQTVRDEGIRLIPWKRPER